MSEPSGIIPSSRAIAPSVKRHSRYYFTDGNVVLQVEGVLFKVHSSLLIQESETFKDMFTLPTAHGLADQQPVEHEHKAASQEGTCDETPIVIPEVTQTSFSNFLFAFYGRPSDPGFQSMMGNAAMTLESHTFYHLHQYLDIADLSHRFAASKLEAWALKQLRGISASTARLALCKQYVNYQLRALSYAKIIQDKILGHRLRTFVELSYSYLLQPPSGGLTLLETEARKQNLLVVFKRPNIQKDNPSLFGFVFCVILSLGQKFWLHHPSLARTDRIILLSTQAHLTPLPFPMLGLDWLESTLTPVNPRGYNPELQSCTNCNFQPAWARAFPGQYIEGMKEKQGPSDGVSLLAQLLGKRMSFVDDLPLLTFNCRDNCKARFIEFVDERIENVFTLAADFYKDIE